MFGFITLSFNFPANLENSAKGSNFFFEALQQMERNILLLSICHVEVNLASVIFSYKQMTTHKRYRWSKWKRSDWRGFFTLKSVCSKFWPAIGFHTIVWNTADWNECSSLNVENQGLKANSCQGKVSWLARQCWIYAICANNCVLW